MGYDYLQKKRSEIIFVCNYLLKSNKIDRFYGVK